MLARINQKLVERYGSFFPFSPRKPRVIILTERIDIATAQAIPLKRAGVADVRTLPIAAFLRGSRRYADADAVCVQTGFHLTDDKMHDLMLRIRRAWRDRPLVYLDWFAPTDLRYAQILDQHIVAYVKKQILADFSRYGKPTIGDTALSDYYAKRFNLALPERQFPIPAGFESKLVLGPGFECSPNTLECLNHPIARSREIDLHARFATGGTEWYSMMRQECKNRALGLEGRFCVACRGQVPRREFQKELRSSKMCFSPFGYGPVCWRDFEAMASGSLLIKQDMSFIKLARPFFAANVTYVPVKWDLSDLEEKVSYYATHHEEREAITHNAHAMLRTCIAKKWFVEDVAPLWRLLGFECTTTQIQASATDSAA